MQLLKMFTASVRTRLRNSAFRRNVQNKTLGWIQSMTVWITSNALILFLLHKSKGTVTHRYRDRSEQVDKDGRVMSVGGLERGVYMCVYVCAWVCLCFSRDCW